ncbi:hypothetical protein GmHk_18G052385 [Glycine max]|nr:hypothetical protein GmHk_18G052385 [Glycine max]
MHQEVFDCVATFFGSKGITWKNYYIPISNGNFYLREMSPHVMQDGGSSQYCIIIMILQRILVGERAVYAMMLVFPPEFSPLKTILFGNHSQDTVEPLMEALEEDYKDGNEINESRQFIGGVLDLQKRINRLDTLT